ncbi:hypothetical protein Golax_010534 [Gossypium laxum]|uniref:Uncharacterized protein n=1 Tax=Gossypium laxum TaxID=34288 RepID=A0A7J8ZHT8_9ROSI|nr:hypothetical protein [Gossypium laxum]
MLPKIEKAKRIRAAMAQQAQTIAPTIPGLNPPEGSNLNGDYGYTVPSKPQNMGLQVANQTPATGTLKKPRTLDGEEVTGEVGEFGTVIVHPGDELRKSFAQSQPHNGKEASTAIEHAERTVINGSRRQGASATVTMEELQLTAKGSSPSIFVYPEQKLRSDSVPEARGKGSNQISSGTLKNETVSKKKAFALQDKLSSIYAAGNTVPIPFLRATDISPIALLSDNFLVGMYRDFSGTMALEALQELFAGDGQSKKGRRAQNEVNSSSSLSFLFLVYLSVRGLSTIFQLIILQMQFPPSVYKRLASSPTLMNLAQALAYHKM